MVWRCTQSGYAAKIRREKSVWKVAVFSVQSIDRCLFLIHCSMHCPRESDSMRINLQSQSPLPCWMTNRACHFSLNATLLVFRMCSGGSFVASEITICKDEGLSKRAAGLWQQPLHLFLLSAAPSLFDFLTSVFSMHYLNHSNLFFLFWLHLSCLSHFIFYLKHHSITVYLKINSPLEGSLT